MKGPFTSHKTLAMVLCKPLISVPSNTPMSHTGREGKGQNKSKTSDLHATIFSVPPRTIGKGHLKKRLLFSKWQEKSR